MTGAPIQVQGVSGLSTMSPRDQALAISNVYAPEFGVSNPGQDLSLTKIDSDANGNNIARYQQTYQGIPVLAGELIVNMTKNGGLQSMSGEVSQQLSLNTQASITPELASQTALGMVAKDNQVNVSALKASPPELMIFDESLLTTSTRPAELVWRMEVKTADPFQPIDEVVLVSQLD